MTIFDAIYDKHNAELKKAREKKEKK